MIVAMHSFLIQSQERRFKIMLDTVKSKCI